MFPTCRIPLTDGTRVVNGGLTEDFGLESSGCREASASRVSSTERVILEFESTPRRGERYGEGVGGIGEETEIVDDEDEMAIGESGS